jgi:hypothetical protein
MMNGRGTRTWARAEMLLGGQPGIRSVDGTVQNQSPCSATARKTCGILTFVERFGIGKVPNSTKPTAVAPDLFQGLVTDICRV